MKEWLYHDKRWNVVNNALWKYAHNGVFTTLLVIDRQPEGLASHLSRLSDHARRFGIDHFALQERVVLELLNGVEEGICRLRLGYWLGEGGVIVGASLEREEGALRLCRQVGVIFWEAKGYDPTIKSFKMRKERLALREAALVRGEDDIVTVDDEGVLLEGSFSNLFWIHDGCLFTPSRTLPILFGLTIQRIIESAKGLGLAVYEVKATLSDIPNEASLFLCNSIIGI
ncbi:aminotransferase class IV, partial [Simkania negevensis]|nr:aminotransferase class IV [Simkania negevensis]